MKFNCFNSWRCTAAEMEYQRCQLAQVLLRFTGARQFAALNKWREWTALMLEKIEKARLKADEEAKEAAQLAAALSVSTQEQPEVTPEPPAAPAPTRRGIPPGCKNKPTTIKQPRQI